MKILILAGGKGSRLTSGPAGHKALTPFEGRPVISRVLDEVGGRGEAEVIVIAPPGLRGLFETECQVEGVAVVETTASTPTAAIRPLIEHDELIVLMHADEICEGSPAIAYAHAAERMGLPVVGATAGEGDSILALARRSTRTVAVASDGRLTDNTAGGARYIGRYAARVDDALLDALPRYPSVLQALIAHRDAIAELTLPKRYFDCGSDALLEASQRRFRGAS